MTLEEIKERMWSGAVYYPSGDELMGEQARALELQYDYNNTRPSESKRRAELLSKERAIA